LSWESDPELRAQVKAILALAPVDRVLNLQDEADVFDRAVLIREAPGDVAPEAGSPRVG
jgi:hypothetical protein